MPPPVDPVGTAQVGQSQVGDAHVRPVVTVPIYTVYKPRPMLMLTIGAGALLCSSEDVELPTEQYGEAQYGEQYGP